MFKLLMLYVFATIQVQLYAQCGGGQTQAAINWDLQYKISSFANPTRFAIGTNSMQLGWSAGVGIVDPPTNNTFTGYGTGGYGAGNMLQLNPGGGDNITFTFNSEVSNAKFAIYDIDESQTITVTATNAASSSVPITMVATNSPTTVSITGSNTNTAIATGGSANLGSTVTTSGVNIDITGPVKTITLSFGGPAGDNPIFFSDIRVCNSSNFSSNYFSVATPDAGQSAFMMANNGLDVFVINIATGIATKLFTAGAGGASGINSLAYDPYKAIVYYIPVVTGTKTIYQYNLRTCTESVLISDVTTVAGSGITLSTNGIAETGGAFYDNAYYFGAEPVNDNGNATIWRLELDNAGVPIQASRTWSVRGINGSSQPITNWGDFVINNGVLYSFAITANSANDIDHYPLDGITATSAYSYGTVIQAGVDYLGNVYRVDNDFALYNNNGTFGSGTTISGGGWSGGASDATGPFKFPSDYGDAPVSYGYASHQKRLCANGGPTSLVRLGATADFELNDIPTLLAVGDDADNYIGSGTTDDEDGVNSFPVITGGTTHPVPSYSVTVAVTNQNPITNATLYAWVDWNCNGLFETTERTSVTVPANTTNGSVNVMWSNRTLSGPNGTAGTYARFRLSTDVNAENPTGSAQDGEVEDYYIPFVIVLPIKLESFTATPESNHVILKWIVTEEINVSRYELEHSIDAIHFTTIGIVNATSIRNYSQLHTSPVSGINYYRLKTIDNDGKISYSPVRTVNFGKGGSLIVYPNPAKDEVRITFTGNMINKPVTIKLFGMDGRIIMQQAIKAASQTETINVSNLANGSYIVQILTTGGIINKQLKIIK